MDGRCAAILDDVLNRALMGSRFNQFLCLWYSDWNMLICSDFGMSLLNSNQRLAYLADLLDHEPFLFVILFCLWFTIRVNF